MSQSANRNISETHLSSPTLVGWRIRRQRENERKNTVHRQLLEQLHKKNPAN